MYSTVKHALHCAFKGRGETPILTGTQIVSDIERLGVIVDSTKRNEPKYLEKCAQDVFTRNQVKKNLSELHWNILAVKYGKNEVCAKFVSLSLAKKMKMDRPYLFLDYVKKWGGIDSRGFNKIAQSHGIKSRQSRNMFNGERLKGKPGVKHYLVGWLEDAEKECELLLTSQDLLRYNVYTY